MLGFGMKDYSSVRYLKTLAILCYSSIANRAKSIARVLEISNIRCLYNSGALRLKAFHTQLIAVMKVRKGPLPCIKCIYSDKESITD